MRSAVIILNGFAALWAGLALSAAHAPAWALAAPVLVSVVLGAALWPAAAAHTRDPVTERRIGRLVAWASFGEGVAILVGVNALAWLGRPDLSLCWVAAVVGLHFLPLARGIPAPVYVWTAAAMTALAAVGVLLPPGVRDVAVGAGGAAVLWATAFSNRARARATAPGQTAAGHGRA